MATQISEALGIFLIVTICLALTPSIASSLTSGKYGLGYTDINEIDPAVDNATALTKGNIRNETGYITITLNVTESNGLTTLVFNTHYTVTDLGTYSTGGEITFSTLNASVPYEATITYDYLIPSVQVSLLNLVPLFWVAAILACLVVYATKKFGYW